MEFGEKPEKYLLTQIDFYLRIVTLSIYFLLLSILLGLFFLEINCNSIFLNTTKLIIE